MSRQPGALRWAVKQSFVRYVRVLAAGTCETSGGAELHPGEVIEFPLLAAARAGGRWELNFAGGVRFIAHHGALDVTLSGLRLDLGPDGGSISIAVGDNRLTIASLPPSEPEERDRSLRWQALLPSLTEAGVEVFGSVYAAGIELAPLDAAVPIDS
ncbi:hypothetical protein GCM10010435_84020 [Winogradskya consettensis]|uniref:Htaa domain-containing protein n=1 Tax=Winogradskya consettensis TaxID=113560 RepID=A0A919T268_9ACTN|nr:HtaA domain-containing protein [Actinoplanes consettensis]GIM82138.1 hypothetical protein Aco04nite_80080 [Actinoplanes consettensis]